LMLPLINFDQFLRIRSYEAYAPKCLEVGCSRKLDGRGVSAHSWRGMIFFSANLPQPAHRLSQKHKSILFY
jgi:hypothetical protein